MAADGLTRYTAIDQEAAMRMNGSPRGSNARIAAAFTAIAAALVLGPPVRAQAAGGPQGFVHQPPVFTAQQATLGKAVFASSGCAMCHGENLGGNGAAGPALVGDTFLSQWHDLTPSQMFAFITGQMPPNAPGSLSVESYRDLAAYIFQANGFAAGVVAFTPSNRFGNGAQRLPAFLQVKHDAYYDAVMARRRAELAQITPVTDQMLRHPSGADWLTWRGSYTGQGYSPLRQINTHNAGGLTVAWSRSLPI
ncbi:MAG: c-type cytochrome, partial [Steroidobacteraceae bacterium]